ncbi:MAG: hypothetical protein NWP80_00755, partial [Candidatus Gracilibacteria bacterium]|nr:hypothetical protein [Candidatus Gracilibacteria bacterium]
NNPDIVDYCNKWKKLINKKILIQKQEDEKLIKNNTFLEAKKLIGDIKIENFDKNKIISKSDGFLTKIKKSVYVYSNFKKKLRDKKLFDEINILLNTNKEIDVIDLKSKITYLHSGFLKKIHGEKINGYDVFGQTYSADKISGDSIGFKEEKNDYKFFIGDATGHGIKAGFIISQLTNFFSIYSSKFTLK